MNPAIYLDREADLGLIAEGKLADIVILDGNPIENIRNVALVNTVIFNGHLYKKQDLDGALAKFK